MVMFTHPDQLDAVIKQAATGQLTYYRTYSRRRANGEREYFDQMVERCVKGLVKVGNLSQPEEKLIRTNMLAATCLPSGRWLWVGGTDWIESPKNFSGAYNCTSTNVDHPEVFGLMMGLAMMGTGTGANLEMKHVGKLPNIQKNLFIKVINKPGDVPKEKRQEDTTINPYGTPYPHHSGLTLRPMNLIVGDSRDGWCDAYQALIDLAMSDDPKCQGYFVSVNVGHVRTKGEELKGFGGVANPVKLADMFPKVAKVLNMAYADGKRQLTPLECCLIIDIAAIVVVAGNVRRSAGMRQFDELGPDGKPSLYKEDLWVEDPETGEWKIDPDRDPLRMANHTRVFHYKPTLAQIKEAVAKQYYSVEGAIQYAPEAERRSGGKGRYGLNPCGEITGQDFHCVAGDTQLITRDGMHAIKDLEGVSTEIWNGKRWSQVTPIETGRNRDLYRVEFSDGSYLDVTEGHKFWIKNRFQNEYQEVTTMELIELIKTLQ